MRRLLSYFSITLRENDLENVSLIKVSNHRGFSKQAWTADYKYPVLECENLQFPIQMQLSSKEKIFSELFFPLMEPPPNFKHFQKKGDPHSQCLSEINDCLRLG